MIVYWAIYLNELTFSFSSFFYENNFINIQIRDKNEKISLILIFFSSACSVNSFANALIMVSLEQLKSATIPQATFENFLKNHNFINDELQKAVDAWGEKPSESAEIWFPICMGYENQIAILENNIQYKK